MVAIERESGTTIGADIQAWVAQLVLPIAFALIAVRLVWRPGFNALNPAAAIVADATMTEPGQRSRWPDRALASLGLVAGVLLVRFPSIIEGQSMWPAYAVVVVAAVAGTPLFAILGGTAALLFMQEGTTPATI
jgi:hypothetical protein